MKISQSKWTSSTGWIERVNDATAPQLVLVFGATAALKQPELLAAIHKKYSGAQIFGCSTAGEICDTEVSDDSIVTLAVQFAKTGIHLEHVSLTDCGGSFAAGEQVVRALPTTMNVGGQAEKLVHVLMLADGLKTNGTDLLAGMTKALPADVKVTGGLAGDGARFNETLVVWDGVAQRDAVVAVGLYGKNLQVGYSAFGGWDPFGPERRITRSQGNVLYEFDGQSALALYKKYLGDRAKDLPGSGLLFPLSLRVAGSETGVVRTILGVDEAAQSMTFAGDVPEGSYARLMMANFDRLVDGAGKAAAASNPSADAAGPDLAILISCVGRKLVLKQRIEDEIEAVRDVMGARTALTGFYSYGEVSPFGSDRKCELHNQTMTVVHLTEK